MAEMAEAGAVTPYDPRLGVSSGAASATRLAPLESSSTKSVGLTINRSFMTRRYMQMCSCIP